MKDMSTEDAPLPFSYLEEEERVPKEIKKKWCRSVKYKKPVHEIDLDDPDLSEEDIWNG